jgi:hypothetical protein
MKRTLSGDLAPTPTQTNSLNDQPAELNESQHQQQAAANDGEPTMHTPNANDPTAENPMFRFDVGEELPDWEEFAQMLPHTPPAEHSRDGHDDDELSTSEDERSTSAWSYEDSGTSDFDEGAAAKILEGIDSGNDTVAIRNLGFREVNEILEICKKNPQVSRLQMNRAMFTSPPRRSTIRSLTDFFTRHQSVRRFELTSTAFPNTKIDVNLLSSLFCNQGLSHLILKNFELVPSSPEEAERLTQSIKNNTGLQRLTWKHCTNNNPDFRIAKALADNSSLQDLEIQLENDQDSCKSLAAHITSNRQLKFLKLDGFTRLTPDHLQMVLSAASNNCGLERLNMEKICFDSLLEGKHLRPLIGNKTLKVLHLPSAEDLTADAVDALIELVQGNPALLGIYLGAVPREHQLRMKLANGLKSNDRLLSIGADFLHFFSVDISDEDRCLEMHEFMKALSQIPKLCNVRFRTFTDLDYLSRFLSSHPKIWGVDIPSWYADLLDQRGKILSLVKQSGQIMHFPSQGKRYGNNEDIMQFRMELNQALRLNQQIDLNIKAASEAMKGILDEKSMTDETLPFVPLDVTNALAKAIARHVPPEKAKAIFDELIVHAPGHQKAM